jgi:hypothetical protein
MHIFYSNLIAPVLMVVIIIGGSTYITFDNSLKNKKQQRDALLSQLK